MPSGLAVQHLQRKGPLSRDVFWVDFIRRYGCMVCAETGVWKADFAEAILFNCPDITAYWLIDVCPQLPGSNKPLNVSDRKFEKTL
jgi:hypothetical protein